MSKYWYYPISMATFIIGEAAVIYLTLKNENIIMTSKYYTNKNNTKIRIIDNKGYKFNIDFRLNSKIIYNYKSYCYYNKPINITYYGIRWDKVGIYPTIIAFNINKPPEEIISQR